MTLFCGPHKQPLVIHLDEICNVSSFFKAAFTSEFREATEKTMSLPDEDPAIVDKFAQWVYRQDYELNENPDTKGRIACFQSLEPLQLLIFSDKYDAPSLRMKLIYQASGSK